MRWMWSIVLVLMVSSCHTKEVQLDGLTEPGVSQVLAQFRSREYQDVKYKLWFDIPDDKRESIAGEVDISWSQTKQLPVVIDFTGDSLQVLSLWMNGVAVEYEVKDEHIQIVSSHTKVGDNNMSIVFRASNQSLNRRDEFLYTLLVPDRARTLFPCFDQPDLKANYTLSLSIPATWKAVANGKVEQIDTLSHPKKHLVTFKETKPLPTYLFSFVAGRLQQETFTKDERTISIYHRETDDQRIAQCSDIADEVLVMMEMLVQQMGQEAFRKGIHHYLTTYAYSNATWDDLIALLSKYSESDLKGFSEVWVKEQGMPVLEAKVENGNLVIVQSDTWGRGLVWPQQLRYRLMEDGIAEDVTVVLEKSSKVAKTELKDSFSTPVILPNIDGRGYGFFKMNAHDMKGAFACMDTTSNELLKGSLLITLNENMQNHNVEVDAYLHALMSYLASEKSNLLYTMALGYLGGGVRFTDADYSWLEKDLWREVEEERNPQFRLQAFRQFVNIAQSKEAANKLYQIWHGEQKPGGVTLAERDYIGLSYQLAIHLPDRAESIVEKQLSRISNPDRREEYKFISPAVSPHKAVRDSVFKALLIADNRSVEPWASSALSLLNHRLRQREAVGYIGAGLCILEEVQQTGDIFFPTVWLRSLLGGHTSIAAREEVEAFWVEHPNYPSMLSNKILQQADHLYRLNEVSEVN